MKILATAIVAMSMTTAAFAQSTPMVSGTVQKVDPSAQKITVKHQPIPHLDMGAMTMVFRAADKDMTGRVKAGDKVQFSAERVNGQLTITAIKKGK